MKIKVETEKKYYCLEPEKLIELALNLNFKQTKKINEIDEYFTDIDSNFIKNRTCLRIRKQDDEKMEITFKGKSNDMLGLYCKLENNISCNIDEYNNYLNLFLSLGYYSYVEVKKERLIYKLKNDKYNYSIMIDKLDELGGFVEFEIISEKEDSKKNELKEELNNLISKFDNLNLKEATKPYRDIVAESKYKKICSNVDQNNIYINIDNELINYEKDFFKKYKEDISKVCKANIKWGTYKKNGEIDNKITNIVDDYLENLIFDSKELFVVINLLKKLNYNIYFVTKMNKIFFKHLFCKLNISLKNVIYLKNENLIQTLKKSNVDISKSIIINNRDLKEINSILLIIINNE